MSCQSVTVILEALPAPVFRVVQWKMEAANSFEMSVLLLITNIHNIIHEQASVLISEVGKTSNHTMVHLMLKLDSSERNYVVSKEIFGPLQ
jgi:hypothetical protein